MKQSEHLVKKMIKKLEKYKSNPAVLEENFPLYVLLVARMHRWEHTWTPVKRLRGKVYIAPSKAKHVRLLGVLLIYKTNHTRVNWTCAHMRTITTFEMLLSLLNYMKKAGHLTSLSPWLMLKEYYVHLIYRVKRFLNLIILCCWSRSVYIFVMKTKAVLLSQHGSVKPHILPCLKLVIFWLYQSSPCQLQLQILTPKLDQ